MKITAFILLAFFVHVSAATLAQTVTLNERKAPLEEVINDIKQQTGYSFFYNQEWMKQAQPVDLSVKQATLDEALKACFKNQPFDYAIINKTIVLKPKEKITKVPNPQPTSIQVTVTGKVVDETGQPLPGVTVKIKNAANALTSTDANGRFTVTVPDDKTVLVFSSIGYESQELAANDIPAGATITLKASQTALSEVQVLNKGYYFEKRQLSTSNVGFVDSKTLSEQPVFDPLNALEGQVAGLDIQQNSGITGAYSVVRIRGVNSISNGTAPLYIIDGVPYNNQSLMGPVINNSLGNGNPGRPAQTGVGSTGGQSPFNGLDINDIENIQVLKDADATAIYGSRGANGVILITTKKGKAGDTKVNVDLSQGIGQVGHFIDLLNTPQYLQIRRQYYTSGGQAIPSIALNPSDGNYDINGLWDQTQYINWQKVLIGNTAHYTKAQASISGGNANTQFLISGGYNRQTTVFQGIYEDKTGYAHLALTHNSSDQKFHAQFTATYDNDNNLIPMADFTGQITLAPDSPPLYLPNGQMNWGLYAGSATFSNPLFNIFRTSQATTNNLISDINLSYTLLPGLTLKSIFGYNHVEMTGNGIIPAASYPPPSNTNSAVRTGRFSTSFSNTWNIEPQINYHKILGKGTFDVLLGSTFQQMIVQNNSLNISGFSADALIIDPAAAPSANASLSEVYSQYRYSSLYGHIGYNWDERYLLSLTARRDGSTSFGPGKQFGNFGAIGAGWIFSKEKFIQAAAKWLTFGKLRANYGISGNDQLQPYQYLSTYNVNNTSYQSITGLAPTSLANPDFAWEVNKKLDGGIDLGFLADRINLSVDYYLNRTGNQLVGYPLSGITGFSTIQYNLPAIIQNTGLEAQLTTYNIKIKDFSWTTSMNFTLPNNKLVSYPGLANSVYKNTYVIGQSLLIKRVYQYTGINPQTGAYSFATANANGTPSSPQDLVSTPPITQKYFGGVQNYISYKNFSLDVFVQFVKQLAPSYQTYFNVPGANGNNEPTAVLNAWTKQSDMSNVIIASSLTANSYNLIKQSTAAYTDASFVRLKNVALSYKIPVDWQRWAHLSNARIYVQGQNLYTLTKYIGLDPETPSLTLPPLRVIMAGVSAAF